MYIYEYMDDFIKVEELVRLEGPDAALVVFAVDDQESLTEAGRILKHLQLSEFIYTQVPRAGGRVQRNPPRQL